MRHEFTALRLGLLLASALTLVACSSNGGIRCSFASPARLATSSWPKFQRDLQNTGAIFVSALGRAPVVRAQFQDPNGGRFLTAPVLGNGSANAVSLDQRLYVGGSNGELFALDTGTLTQLPQTEFTFSVTSGIQTTPLVGVKDGEEVLFFGSELGFVYGITHSGHRQQAAWPLNTGGATGLAVSLNPTDGTVYVASSSRALYAVCPNGVRRFVSGSVAPLVGAPAVTPAGEVIYGGEDRILRMERADGFLLWTLSLSAPLRNAPVVELDGSDPSKVKAIYAVDTRGRLFKVSPRGELVYTRSLGSEADLLSVAVAGSPALATGRLYVATTEGELLSVDTETGEPVWSFSAGAGVVASPAVLVHAEGKTVVVGTTNGELLFVEDLGEAPRLAFAVTVNGAIRQPVAVSAAESAPVFFVADDSGTISRIE
ncbi:Desiccation/radiation resistance protein [bacterium HR30]|nr:Desiccation/radiation resistance protein [bacterium HR30]